MTIAANDNKKGFAYIARTNAAAIQNLARLTDAYRFPVDIVLQGSQVYLNETSHNRNLAAVTMTQAQMRMLAETIYARLIYPMMGDFFRLAAKENLARQEEAWKRPWLEAKLERDLLHPHALPVSMRSRENLEELCEEKMLGRIDKKLYLFLDNNCTRLMVPLDGQSKLTGRAELTDAEKIYGCFVLGEIARDIRDTCDWRRWGSMEEAADSRRVYLDQVGSGSFSGRYATFRAGNFYPSFESPAPGA